MSDIREQVKEYYSNLKSSGDLKTEVCTCGSAPKDIQAIIDELPAEICEKFYGCGSPIPPMLEGCTVLDLGCGTGRDVFVCSKLVGETGKVIGVDMNEDQLAVGNKYKDEVAKKFGYAASNVEFKQGYIEDLKSLGIEDGSIDVVISNCVINLSLQRGRLLRDLARPHLRRRALLLRRLWRSPYARGAGKRPRPAWRVHLRRHVH